MNSRNKARPTAVGSVCAHLLFLASTTLAAAQAPTLVQQIQINEAKWLDAYYRFDVATLDSIESDDFNLITPPSVLTREQHRALVLSQLATQKAPNTPQKYKLDSQVIRSYGNVAIVTDVCTVGAGDRIVNSPGVYWQTEVWQSDGTKWKIVHIHISPVLHTK